MNAVSCVGIVFYKLPVHCLQQTKELLYQLIQPQYHLLPTPNQRAIVLILLYSSLFFVAFRTMRSMPEHKHIITVFEVFWKSNLFWKIGYKIYRRDLQGDIKEFMQELSVTLFLRTDLFNLILEAVYRKCHLVYDVCVHHPALLGPLVLIELFFFFFLFFLFSF
jgi:hypothetical protein